MAGTQDVDESAGLPNVVLDQGKKAEALQKAILGNTGKEPVAPVVAAPPAPAIPAEGVQPATPPVVPAGQEVAPVVATPPVKPPVQLAAAPEETWEQRFKVLQGKYDNEILTLTGQVGKQNTILQDQAEMMSGLLRELDQFRSGQVPPAGQSGAGFEGTQPAVTNIEPENYEGFGQEIVDLAAEVKDLRRENQSLKGKTEASAATTEQMAKDGMYKYLDENAGGWRTLNLDPAFLAWLGQPDLLSGARRQQLLDFALADFDGARVANFFQTYIRESGGIQQTVIPVPPVPPGEQPVIPQPVILPAEVLGGDQPPVDGTGAMITRDEYLRAQKDVQTERMTGKEFEELSNRYLTQQLAAQKALAGGR